MTNLLRIKNLDIGGQHPCRIIAELGTLHHHEGINRLFDLTGKFFQLGADIVKIQLIDPDNAWWATPQQLQRYKRLYEKFGLVYWIEYIRTANYHNNGPVISSIFDSSTFYHLRQILPAVKLGYKTNQLPEFRDTIIKSGMPTILSCTEYELVEQYPNLVKLHVQLPYPMYQEWSIHSLGYRTRWSDSDVVGLSCHSPYPYTLGSVCSAVLQGAKLIEVHVQDENADGADTLFALTPTQFSNLVDAVRKTEYLMTKLKI